MNNAETTVRNPAWWKLKSKNPYYYYSLGVLTGCWVLCFFAHRSLAILLLAILLFAFVAWRCRCTRSIPLYIATGFLLFVLYLLSIPPVAIIFDVKFSDDREFKNVNDQELKYHVMAAMDAPYRWIRSTKPGSSMLEYYERGWYEKELMRRYRRSWQNIK